MKTMSILNILFSLKRSGLSTHDIAKLLESSNIKLTAEILKTNPQLLIDPSLRLSIESRV